MNKKLTELRKKVTCVLSALCFLLCSLGGHGHRPHGSSCGRSRRAAVKTEKDGELSATTTGVNKQKMTIGKLDPPAAFNLEDIQNFPEDRLHPVLNNPVTFEEGRDFSNMMDSQDEKLIHPWLPEIAKAPFLTMKPVLDKPAKDWTFSVIDQGGSAVSTRRTAREVPLALFLDRR